MKKNNKRFSGISKLPNGNTSNKIVPGCIVLEGGAFRGLYTSGVLDALMQFEINMQCTVGTSAGALNGFNYVAGQIGRSARINLGYRHDSRYVGLEAFKNNKGIIGFDFLMKGTQYFDPLNTPRFMNPTRDFIAVCTNCKTGRPEYFSKNKTQDIFKAVQASATMPYVSKMVEIEDGLYLDGGCSDKIAYQWFTGTSKDKEAGKGLSGKYGIIRQSVLSKTTDYGTRLVLSAPELKVENLDDMKTSLNYTCIPLYKLYRRFCSVFGLSRS